MGPKRTDTVNRGNKPTQSSLSVSGPTYAAVVGEQENQQCVGKFAADLELCCREPPLAYPINIPVHIRGHPPPSSQYHSFPQQNPQQQQQQQRLSGTHSGTSVTPSLAGGMGEEQLSSIGKKTSRPRISSGGQTGFLIGVTGIDNDSRSLSIPGQEPSKVSSSAYKTFHQLRDSDIFRPKLLADSLGNENEPVDQITALYMRAWQLDQRFIEILKKTLPLQEHLHTLNFGFVGLNEQTIYGFVELCQVTKTLKSVSLDGNPLASEYFYLLIEKDDLKIAHLSLRFCNITGAGAERLAHVLGNMSTQNGKLLTLSLSGNRIGDNGANCFAQALRFNRTLISLNLSSNFITDQGAVPLALVLRRIVLTPEEIIRRRYLIAERYAETHPDDLRNNASSPTPSNKSKSGRGGWNRFADPNKRKPNPTKIAQVVADKRNRPESENDTRPPSGSKGDPKRGRNEGSGGRSSTLNPPSTSGNASRRAAPGTSNPNSKDSDQPRISVPIRVKKMAAAVSAASKKNISVVREEDENANEEGRPSDLSSSGKFISLQIQQFDRENPLLEINESESHDGEIWLKGNFVLLNLNLSRNYLTMDTVKEFLLSIQQQSALTNFNNSLGSLSTTAPLIDFSGLCRLELKGMNDISSKSPEYQSLESLLIQKSPSTRFQQIKERDNKDLLDPQSIQQTLLEKASNISEKSRIGSSFKTTTQRPTSRLKE